MRIDTIEALEAIYGTPNLASTAKVADRVTPQYRQLIEASPFLVLATAGPEGLDASPRGDAHGLVRIADDRTLLLPDRRGNNRVDSLRNIVRDPRVGLLFLSWLVTLRGFLLHRVFELLDKRGTKDACRQRQQRHAEKA